MVYGQVVFAVHSMKDVPTALPIGIVQAAVLERANSVDILVHKGNLDFLNSEGTIATGSLRRQAQWLNKYPTHKTVDIRGNINTRLKKLEESDWNGAIFAAAGLERINIKPENFIDLWWMIPAPAQGAMVVVAMEKDAFCREALAKLNHQETEICTHIEREFLKTLEGGCSAPIGALAKPNGASIEFEGVLYSLDGKVKFESKKSCTFESYKNFGKDCAEEILKNGAAALMESIRSDLKK